MRIVLIFSILLASLSVSFAQNSQTGEASYYNDKYQGRKTASGELYDRSKYTSAHRTLPFGALVQVTNLKNNKAVIVKINDMGPSKESRIVDLSYAAAEAIGLVRMGVAPVRVDVLEEYPKANSPYAVGPVIGTSARPAPTSSTSAASNQRTTDAAAATGTITPVSATSSRTDDLVIPNIRPSDGSTTAPSIPAASMRTAETKTAEAVPIGNKGLGLFKFFAQRVTAEGYGVQVGAFSDYRNVMEATATLSQKGVEDFLVQVKPSGDEVVYKLIVGPFNSRGAADSFSKQLSLIPGFSKGMVFSLSSL